MMAKKKTKYSEEWYQMRGSDGLPLIVINANHLVRWYSLDEVKKAKGKEVFKRASWHGVK